MRKTKCFSYEARQARFWRMLEREARIERRSFSAELFLILEDFFERKKFLKTIQNQKTDEN